MITLTLNNIYLSTEKEKSKIGFDYKYVGSSYNCMGSTNLSYPLAIRVFKSMGLEQQAVSLKYRVERFSPFAEDIDAIKKEIWEIPTKSSSEQSKKFNEQLLGPNLYRFEIQFHGESYERDPFGQHLREVAISEGHYKPVPTSMEEFLKEAAKSLAKFEEPFQNEIFLFSQSDLDRLYKEYRDNSKNKELKDRVGDDEDITDSTHGGVNYHFLKLLKESIAKEASPKKVTLHVSENSIAYRDAGATKKLYINIDRMVGVFEIQFSGHSDGHIFKLMGINSI